MQKSIVALLLIVCLASANNLGLQSNNITTATKVKDLAMGLAIGMGALQYMPDALPCVTEVETIIPEIEKVIADFKSGKILDVIPEIEKLAKEFLTNMGSCKSLSAEGKSFFGNVLQHFVQHQYQIQGLENILLNLKTVKADLTNGINSFKNAQQETDYLVAGNNFGQIIKIYVNGSSSANLNSFLAVAGNSTLLQKIEMLGIGFVFGSGVLAKLPDALPCLSDVSTLKTEIQTIIGDYKNHSFIKMIEEVYKVLKQVTGDIKSCGALEKEAVALFKDVSQVVTNSTRRSEGLSNLMNNIQAVEQDLSSIVKSVEAGTAQDFENVGVSVGNIFKIFVWGTATEQAQLASDAVVIKKVENNFLGFRQ